MNMMNMMQNQNACGSNSGCDNPFELALAMNPMFQMFKMSPVSEVLKTTPMYKFWHAFHHQMWLADVMKNGMGSSCHMGIPGAVGSCCPLTGKPLRPSTGCPLNSCNIGANPMMSGTCGGMNNCHSGRGMEHMIAKMFMNPMCGAMCSNMSSCCPCPITAPCHSMMSSHDMNAHHPHDVYKMMIQYYGNFAEKLAHCSSDMLNKCKVGDSSCHSSSWCGMKPCCFIEQMKCLENFTNDWTEYFAKFQEKMTWWNEKVTANMKLIQENIKCLKEQACEYKKSCSDDKKSSDKMDKPVK